MDCQRKQIMHNLKDPKGEEKRAPENWISKTYLQTNVEKPSMLVLYVS